MISFSQEGRKHVKWGPTQWSSIVLWLHFAESTGGMNMKTDVNYLAIVFSFAIARLYPYTDILNTVDVI